MDKKNVEPAEKINTPQGGGKLFSNVQLCWNTCRNYHNNGDYGCTHPEPMSLNNKTVKPLKCPGFKPVLENALTSPRGVSISEREEAP